MTLLHNIQVNHETVETRSVQGFSDCQRDDNGRYRGSWVVLSTELSDGGSRTGRRGMGRELDYPTSRDT